MPSSDIPSVTFHNYKDTLNKKRSKGQIVSPIRRTLLDCNNNSQSSLKNLSLDTLPKEIIHKILNHVSISDDYMSVRLVNRKMNNIMTKSADSNSHWLISGIPPTKLPSYVKANVGYVPTFSSYIEKEVYQNTNMNNDKISHNWQKMDIVSFNQQHISLNAFEYDKIIYTKRIIDGQELVLPQTWIGLRRKGDRTIQAPMPLHFLSDDWKTQIRFNQLFNKHTIIDDKARIKLLSFFVEDDKETSSEKMNKILNNFNFENIGYFEVEIIEPPKPNTSIELPMNLEENNNENNDLNNVIFDLNAFNDDESANTEDTITPTNSNAHFPVDSTPLTMDASSMSMRIGLAREGYSSIHPVGCLPNSVGMCSADGYIALGHRDGEVFQLSKDWGTKKGDVVGCGFVIDPVLDRGIIFFTCNGKWVGDAPYRVTNDFSKDYRNSWHPSFSSFVSCKVRFNYGQLPFKYQMYNVNKMTDTLNEQIDNINSLKDLETFLSVFKNGKAKVEVSTVLSKRWQKCRIRSELFNKNQPIPNIKIIDPSKIFLLAENDNLNMINGSPDIVQFNDAPTPNFNNSPNPLEEAFLMVNGFNTNELDIENADTVSFESINDENIPPVPVNDNVNTINTFGLRIDPNAIPISPALSSITESLIPSTTALFSGQPGLTTEISESSFLLANNYLNSASSTENDYISPLRSIINDYSGNQRVERMIRNQSPGNLSIQRTRRYSESAVGSHISSFIMRSPNTSLKSPMRHDSTGGFLMTSPLHSNYHNTNRKGYYMSGVISPTIREDDEYNNNLYNSKFDLVWKKNELYQSIKSQIRKNSKILIDMNTNNSKLFAPLTKDINDVPLIAPAAELDLTIRKLNSPISVAYCQDDNNFSLKDYTRDLHKNGSLGTNLKMVFGSDFYVFPGDSAVRATTLQSPFPMEFFPPYLSKYIRYFEIDLMDGGLGSNSFLSFGLATRPYTPYHQVGWGAYSVGLHTDDGKLYDNILQDGIDFADPIDIEDIKNEMLDLRRKNRRRKSKGKTINEENDDFNTIRQKWINKKSASRIIKEVNVSESSHNNTEERINHSDDLISELEIDAVDDVRGIITEIREIANNIERIIDRIQTEENDGFDANYDNSISPVLPRVPPSSPSGINDLNTTISINHIATTVSRNSEQELPLTSTIDNNFSPTSRDEEITHLRTEFSTVVGDIDRVFERLERTSDVPTIEINNSNFDSDQESLSDSNSNTDSDSELDSEEEMNIEELNAIVEEDIEAVRNIPKTTIGCGIDLQRSLIFFTRDGRLLGTAPYIWNGHATISAIRSWKIKFRLDGFAYKGEGLI